MSDLELSASEDDVETPFDLAIQTCIAKGNSPRSIMAIINSFIIGLKLDKDLLSLHKVKQRIDQLYGDKIDAHEDTYHHLTYLGKKVPIIAI